MFPFDFAKTLQAVAYLLAKTPNRRMNYTKLIKLIYLADRQSLRDTGEPMTGDIVWAMDNGPVLGRLYDLIKDVTPLQRWWDVIRREGYEIVLCADCGHDCLCEYELETLDALWAQYRYASYTDVIDFTHTLAEWRENEPEPGSRKAIPLDDILKAVGRSGDADEIKREAKAKCAHAQLMGE